MTTTIRITHAGDSVTMTCDLSRAEAPILVDGRPIGRQTADARHRTADAVRLVCIATWPEDGHDAWEDGGESWEAMGYEPIEPTIDPLDHDESDYGTVDEMTGRRV